MNVQTESPPPAWRALTDAARERGLRPDLLRVELEIRRCKLMRFGHRGLHYVAADDLARFDSAVVAEAAANAGVPA